MEMESQSLVAESTIPLNDIISKEPSSIVITTSPPVLPIKDPKDSLIMGNEELNTIPEKESDEFINFSVEDLVPIQSEFEDTSGSESVCILPSCDDFSPINVPKEKAVTFSNPVFNSNDDFIFSDDESLSDEDVPEDNDSYDPNLDEPDLLVTPLSDANKDECFDSRGNVDKINDFEDGYYDLEGDILYLENSFSDDTTPNLPPEFDDPIIKVMFSMFSQKSSLWTRVIKAIHGDDGKLDKDVIVGGQTCWTSIVKEARSLKGTGINVVDLIRLKLGNGDSFSFWEDKWYAGGVIKELFPRLYALELHKHATVRMKLMAPSLDNSFRRRVRSGAEESQFNSLLEIVQVINLVPCEDMYFWSLESEGDYSVASIRKLIDEKRF
uniref:RNA-directed DNA polymerase, eukaryota, reverse transcriptase zinc-binding domain protein n=1 Tax=Tanacetum cinerariifolium TaxID=118510 RepID=A0A6L2JEL3_TANCI|nr:RNA-directed DNA polymerase, eukaryota, reverse transcriptase zinc-binding domain protein [Tanacetum cinerariifolium]